MCGHDCGSTVGASGKRVEAVVMGLLPLCLLLMVLSLSRAVTVVQWFTAQGHPSQVGNTF